MNTTRLTKAEIMQGSHWSSQSPVWARTGIWGVTFLSVGAVILLSSENTSAGAALLALGVALTLPHLVYMVVRFSKRDQFIDLLVNKQLALDEAKERYGYYAIVEPKQTEAWTWKSRATTITWSRGGRWVPVLLTFPDENSHLIVTDAAGRELPHVTQDQWVQNSL